MNQNEKKILDTFRSAAWEISEIEVSSTLSLDTRVSDLDIDSITLIEIIGQIENKFNINLPEEKLFKAETIRDISNALKFSMH